MVYISAITAGERFDLPQYADGTLQLRQDVQFGPSRPLELSILLALTLNEVSCRSGSGFFYWLPSQGDLGRRRTIRVKMLTEDGLSKDQINTLVPANSTSADLLFLKHYQWTEADRQRWIKSDGCSRQNLCEGQMNWWNKRPALVLPIYVHMCHLDSANIRAGPRVDPHDGVMILFRPGPGTQGFHIYLDTLLSTRGTTTLSGSGSRGNRREATFSRNIFDLNKRKSQEIGEGRLAAWAQVWLRNKQIQPSTIEELVARISQMYSGQPHLLEFWDAALARTYV